MKAGLILALAALPLAAQPRLLINAKVDARSAAAGLDREFRALLAAEPQPAWIGWMVPSVRSYSLGCEYVSHDGWAAPGVIHLEPPDHAVILFRAVDHAVERIRAFSPDCEIDAGGVPVHWLNDVKPPESVALLAGQATDSETAGNSAVGAIAVHDDAAADAALDRFAAAGQPDNLRRRAIGWLGSARGRHGLETLRGLLAGDTNPALRARVIGAIAESKDPDAITLLVATARNDRDREVERRAIAALGNLPAGKGVPVLIEITQTSKDVDMRKHAMNALQQTHDPRALGFFERVLQ
ncbi:MAG: HEAT repeat domain-containing protein [Bryobacteraceae bacterium]|jgi:HEAT repeat protein